MNEIRQYVRDDGHCPFADWFAELGNQAAAKVATALERMRGGNFGDHKSLGRGVQERRINYGPGYPLDFGRDGETLVVLVGGGTKSRQSADIQQAQATWAQYKVTMHKATKHKATNKQGSDHGKHPSRPSDDPPKSEAGPGVPGRPDR